MGTFSKDDYETGTKAALVGGTTTIFDMCCPSRAMEPSEGFATWKAQAHGKAACDYSFHMGVTRFDGHSADQLREIVAAGVQSFKIFLAYKGAFGIDDSELYQTLKLAKELGVVTYRALRKRNSRRRNAKRASHRAELPDRKGITTAALRGWKPKV